VELRTELEGLFEGRNAGIGASKRVSAVFHEIVTRIESFELGQRVVAKIAMPIGRPVERRVVEAHEVPIGGLVDVGFDVRVPEVGSIAKRDQCVFRPTFRAAAVRESEGSRRAKVRARHRVGSIAPFVSPRAQHLSAPVFLCIVSR